MKKFVCLLVFITSLTACSSKIAYNNVDWWIYWYLDDYVELTDEQKTVFDEYLNTWRQWHKSTELSKYKTQLEEIKQDVLTNRLTSERILAHLLHARTHWTRARDKVSPDVAAIAKTLSDEQVVTLFAQIEKENREEIEKRQDYLSLSEKEKEKKQKRKAQLLESVEEQIGRLTDTQEQIIATYSEQYLSTRDEWINYRETMTNAARRIIATRHINKDFEQQLITLIQNPDTYRSPMYINARAHNAEVMAAMVSELATTLSDKQKHVFIGNIEDVIEDIEGFME